MTKQSKIFKKYKGLKGAVPDRIRGKVRQANKIVEESRLLDEEETKERDGDFMFDYFSGYCEADDRHLYIYGG